MGTGPSEKSLPPDPRPAQSGPALELSLDEDQLASLEARPDQGLDVGVKNSGDEELTDVHLTLEVSSGNTALSDASYYRKTVDEVAAGRTVDRHFYLDLSVQESTVGSSMTAVAVPESPRKIVEVRASTPEGVSAIKTAIVPL